MAAIPSQKGRIVNRGLHLRITPMTVKLQCQKCVLTGGGVFVDVITFEIELNVLMVA